MKLWLDDVRPAPPGGWTHVENFDLAIGYLEEHRDGLYVIEVASLDHDLGMIACKACRQAQPTYAEWKMVQDLGCVHGDRSGYDVICWMEEHGVWPELVIIHSMNPAGARRMFEVAKRYTDARLIPFSSNSVDT